MLHPGLFKIKWGWGIGQKTVSVTKHRRKNPLLVAVSPRTPAFPPCPQSDPHLHQPNCFLQWSGNVTLTYWPKLHRALI